MGVFSKKYDEVIEAVVTEGRIYSYPQKDGKMLSAELKTAMWDTGSMVGIPTGDVVTDIYVTECSGDSYDAVIGMDIIGLGDFAFTNKESKSCFSFRLPSKEHIELTE